MTIHIPDHSRGSLSLAIAVCLLTAGCNSRPEEPAAGPEVAPAQNVANNPQVPEKPKGKAIIGKDGNRVGDYAQLMKDNPDLIRSQGGINESQYIRARTKSIAATGTRASKLSMVQSVQMFKAEHGRFPTHEELLNVIDDLGLAFTELPENEVYAYNHETGEVLVLKRPLRK